MTDRTSAGRKRRPGRALRAAWMAAAVALAPASAAPLGPIDVVVTGSSAPRLLLAPRAGSLAVLRVTFDVGSADDASSPGLTRLAQWALLEANEQLAPGALTLGAWASDGRLELTTTHRTCTFTLVADRRDFTPLARQLLRALLAPRLTPSRFPAAVERAVLDVGHDADLVTALIGLSLSDRVFRTHPPHGLRRVLESLDLDEVRAHVERRFAPARAEVVLAGAFDRRALVELVGGFRGGARGRPARVELEAASARRESDREVHVLAFPLRLESAADAAAARILAALLDGALWREVRETGFGYSFDVPIVRSPWLDALIVVVPAHEAETGALGDTLVQAIQRVRDGGFSEEQLARARDRAGTELRAADEDPVALAAELAAGGPGWHGPAVEAAIAALDGAALRERARAWLEPAQAAALYLGPAP